MCGIVGLFGFSPVNQQLYDALTVLQHRGQDAAGIVTQKDSKFFLRKQNGLVRDVFHTRHMRRLVGNIGIGHVRYPTAGTDGSSESQPFYVNSPYGIVLAHNGNLTNAELLKTELFNADLRHLNTRSDSEVLLNIFADELLKQKEIVPSPDNIFKAVAGVHNRVRGAYAVVAMIAGHGMVAFRDPNGIRPVIYGKRVLEDKRVEYMVASESVALDVLGFEVIADIAPGEAIYIDSNGNIFNRLCAAETKLTPCIFEFVYFARPDSMIDGISVYKSRLRMGEALAKKIKREWPDHDIDVVIPIPDTSRTSAMQLAAELKVKFREGFMKNRYIGRTFIMPEQEERKKSVRQKLNPIALEFKNRNVLLVDDSIVRGTTCEQIIDMARASGANNVYFASAAPPIRHPNVYGIDMPSSEELIASNRTTEQVCAEIKADRMIYQDLQDLIESAKTTESSVSELECSVFDGCYITGDVDEKYLDELHSMRNNSSKCKIRDQEDESSLVDMHNDN